MINAYFDTKCTNGFQGLVAHSKKPRVYFSCRCNSVLTCECGPEEIFNATTLQCEVKNFQSVNNAIKKDLPEEGFVEPQKLTPVIDSNHQEKLSELRIMINKLNELRAAKRFVDTFKGREDHVVGWQISSTATEHPMPPASIPFAEPNKNADQVHIPHFASHPTQPDAAPEPFDKTSSDTIPPDPALAQIDAETPAEAQTSDPSKVRWVFPRRLIRTIINFFLRGSGDSDPIVSAPEPAADVEPAGEVIEPAGEVVEPIEPVAEPADPVVGAPKPGDQDFGSLEGRSLNSSETEDLSPAIETTTLTVDQRDAKEKQVDPNWKNRLVTGLQRKIEKPVKKNETDNDYVLGVLFDDDDDDHEFMELYDIIEYYHEDEPNITLYTKEGDFKEIVKVKKVGEEYVIVSTTTTKATVQQENSTPIPKLHLGDIVARARAYEYTSESPTTVPAVDNLEESESSDVEFKIKTTTPNCTIGDELPDDYVEVTFAPFAANLTAEASEIIVRAEPVTYKSPPIMNLVTFKPKPCENATKGGDEVTKVGEETSTFMSMVSSRDYAAGEEGLETTTKPADGFEEYYEEEEYESLTP